ncbi:globin family protein [Acidithiobacillus thiooxidans]|uniref:hypothetical protein n=1 Tax=Acidithiobacillus thiooxidans TaxID=930 RepID=UPI001C07B9CB|nr:hypothetical protein [Acidithiobacillus thiooxidans]MBU2842838.1 hypothetical protein [Acidithiobacillus thiooxidans]
MNKGPSIESAGYAEPYWIQAAYGADAAASLSHLGSLESRVDQAVRNLYTGMMLHPSARSVLEQLDAEELQQLVSTQCRYFLKVFSPDIRAEEHYQMAVAVGLRHVAYSGPQI